MARHFLDLADIAADELRAIIESAKTRKAAQKAGTADKPLAGKALAMIFEKPSTRTRVSFDVGMRQLGGETIMLTGAEMQLGRDETIADTAKVLSRYVDIIMIRTSAHDRLQELAAAATVPVINGLTDDTHPCQIMADIMAFEEHMGAIKGKKLAWTGDGNNVLHSLIEGAAKFGYEVAAAVPPGHEPMEKFVTDARNAGAQITVTHNAEEAVSGAHGVVTDTWVSMHQQGHTNAANLFGPYQVNEQLMAKAAPGAVFMHCLPAHRGEEVTDTVIDGPQSIVFDEAENRMHAQKAIIEWCMQG